MGLLYLYLLPCITKYVKIDRRSQWPRGLRRRFTAARLLRTLVRIPPGAWIFICCVCVVCCQVEVSATSWSLVQRNPIECGVSLCVITKPRERGGHSSRWAAVPEKIMIKISIDCPTNALICMLLYSHDGSYMFWQNNAILMEQLGSFLSYFNVNMVGDKSWKVWCRPMCQRAMQWTAMAHYQLHTSGYKSTSI
jgi:hypothetical protein